MSASKVKVGYLGPDNCTFGFQAFTQAFSPEAGICHERPNPSPFSSHHDICDAVGRLDVRYGVVAVENAIDGVVAETIRSIESVSNHLGLFVCGEVTVPIKLFYMNKSGEDKTPKRLLSHPTALGQCRRFVAELQKKGVSVEVRPSTGQAAKDALADPDAAALASQPALDHYGLKRIRPDSMTDHKNSVTRFWILGKQHARKSEKGKDKTSFLVNLEQAASGVLHKTLGVFAQNNIPVLLMYPTPVLGKKWEYTFLVEVSGHVDDPAMIKAWDEFRDLGISLQPLKFIGSYPDITSPKS